MERVNGAGGASPPGGNDDAGLTFPGLRRHRVPGLWHTLRGHEVVECAEDEWFAGSIVRRLTQGRVGWATIRGRAGRRATISTVFTGLNTAPPGQPPEVFETMVFVPKPGGRAVWAWRDATWADARARHRRVVALARIGLSPARRARLLRRVRRALRRRG